MAHQLVISNRRRWRGWLVGGIGFMTVFLLGGLALAAQTPYREGPSASLATSDERAVAAVLARAIHARAVAARTFDLSGLAATYVDDPSIPVTQKQATVLNRLTPGGRQGILSFYRAYFADWAAGAAAFARVQAAYRAGKLPDAVDVQAAMPPRADPIYTLPLTMRTVVITGDRAYIEAEDGPTYYRVTLVRHGQQWLIAGENNTTRP